jgi:hypothetical protein
MGKKECYISLLEEAAGECHFKRQRSRRKDILSSIFKEIVCDLGDI